MASITIFVFVLIFGIGQAKADFWATNENTGYESDNKAETDVNSEFEVSNHNLESILNLGEGIVNTGDNEVEENTDDSEIETGNIIAGGGFVNVVNFNETHGSTTILADFTAINDTTGAESDNEAEIELVSETEIRSCSMVHAVNTAGMDVNTGENEAEENTGEGLIETGDIGALIMNGNFANGNLVEIDNNDPDDGIFNFMAMATNMITGADSDNEASTEIENEVEVNNFNTASIFNLAYIGANTGENEVEENTMEGELTTGLIVAEVELENSVNMAYNLLNLNSGTGMIEIENSNTGHNSDNEVDVEIENEVELKNTNFSMLNNMVEIGLNTGGNEMEENTGDSNLGTGDVSADVAITNGDESAQNHNEVNIDLSMMTITGSNDTTGADSDNEVGADVENKVKIKNFNMQNIMNGVAVSENTGGNEVEENTGSGSVETGDVDTTVVVENQVNTNCNMINSSPVVDINLSNSNTGAESDNEAEANIENKFEVVNENSGIVTNNIVTESNTGNNEVNENTGSGSVSSGDATVLFGALNVANSNSTSISQ